MKKILFFFIVLFSLNSFGQQEASYWYFGQNAGLHFDSANNTVTATTDGQLSTLEGCTSISDANGNLLFYSDGRTVWNQNHLIMLNGTGLKGDDSSTSSGVIVPKPQDPNFYYIFTVDEPHHNNTSNALPNNPPDGDGINDGLMYSLVDMSLAGGLGGIDPIEKNIPLTTYDPFDQLQSEYKCSEKITAVKADDCYSFWVITHFIDKFYAFKVDSFGVDPNPVISTVGPNVPIQGYRRNALGYIKASPDGTKLAVAHFGFSTVTAGDAAGGVYLFDFDNNTGTVSNSLELYGPQNAGSPYGVEFSAENKRVYATIGAGTGGGGTSSLLQWDLEASNIPNSQQTIHTSNSISAGALQLGIDKRIYRAQMDFSNFSNSGRHLGVIENPEELGNNVIYNEQGILLDINGNFQNISRIGLPPFIQSLFNTEIDIIQNNISTTNLNLCNGDTYTLVSEDIPGATYTWTLDGNLLAENDFDLVVSQNGHYEVFIEQNNGECPIEGQAFVSYFDIPTANQPSDIIICDDDNDSFWSFDFSIQDSDILGTQDATQFSVKYFETQEDADNNVNEIIGNYTNTSNPQTIYVRIENIGNSGCYDTTFFEIEVFDTPTANPINDYILCDDDLDGDETNGQTEFDLASLIPDILGTQSDTDFAVSFHTNQTDADDNLNAIGNLYSNVVPNQEQIFVRVENINNTDCFDTTSLNLIVNPLPEAFNTNLLQCDEDGIPEGFTLFNLTEANEVITGGATNVSTKFYTTLLDAQNSENEVDGTSFSNWFNPQTIYVQVIENTTGCFNISELTLEVSTTNANDAVLETCDDDGNEDGLYSFNLLDAEADILNGLPTDLDVSYYETYEDALLETNAISTNYTNTIPYSQTIYVRVENDNACFGINEIQLTVFELPNLETEFETLYCLNSFPDSITLTGGVLNDLPNNYYYDWSTGENTSEIQVNEPGIFTVTVTNTLGCSKSRTINVLPSNIATIDNIDIVDASSNNTITVFVSGEGDYEYALDNIFGPYSDSNFFENVSPGLHTVFVRDKNDCGITEEIISVIGFPKFFTPNNDGYNDYWQVKGINSQFQPNTVIYIFNRHGKLLVQIDPLSSGWNGNYNGNPMPSDDYWFAITLQDGRVYKNHFTLKR